MRKFKYRFTYNTFAGPSGPEQTVVCEGEGYPSHITPQKGDELEIWEWRRVHWIRRDWVKITGQA